jgi:hypothetical protein
VHVLYPVVTAGRASLAAFLGRAALCVSPSKRMAKALPAYILVLLAAVAVMTALSSTGYFFRGHHLHRLNPCT